jgi:hypothetical protein
LHSRLADDRFQSENEDATRVFSGGIIAKVLGRPEMLIDVTIEDSRLSKKGG